MFQPYVTPLTLALVIAVHAACLVGWVAILRAGTATPEPGWRTVGPSGSHWFCFFGSWTLASLMSWVWLFVGSARRDAETQMWYALLLILAFGLCAAGSAFYIARLRRTHLCWRETTIRWREGNADVVEDMSDFVAFRTTLSGLHQLRFRDGAILKLDRYARNAGELATEIAERVGGGATLLE